MKTDYLRLLIEFPNYAEACGLTNFYTGWRSQAFKLVYLVPGCAAG